MQIMSLKHSFNLNFLQDNKSLKHVPFETIKNQLIESSNKNNQKTIYRVEIGDIIYAAKQIKNLSQSQSEKLLEEVAHINDDSDQNSYILKIFAFSLNELSFQVYDVYLISELMQQNLELVVNEPVKSQMTALQKLNICLKLSKSLQAIHMLQIFHGNMKLTNILTDQSMQRVLLCDISSIIQKDDPQQTAKEKNADDVFIFECPQAIKDAQSLSQSGDVWTLGLLFCHILLDPAKIQLNGRKTDVKLGEMDRFSIYQDKSISSNTLEKFKTLIENMLKLDPLERSKVIYIESVLTQIMQNPLQNSIEGIPEKPINSNENQSQSTTPVPPSPIEDGIAYFSKGLFKQSLSFFTEKLKGLEKPTKNSKNNIQYFKLVWWVIRLRIELGMLTEANTEVKEMLKITLEKDNEEIQGQFYARFLILNGFVQFQLGNYTEASLLIQESLELYTKIFGEASKECLEVISLCAEFDFQNGKIANFTNFYPQYLEKFESTKLDIHLNYEYIQCLSIVCADICYSDKKIINYFETQLEKLVDELSKINDHHPIQGIFNLFTGIKQLELSQYEEAQVSLNQSYHIFNQIFGEHHPRTLTALFYEAKVQHIMGNYDTALEQYKYVMEIREMELGLTHHHTLLVKSSIGVLYENQGLEEQAQPYYEEVYETAKKTLGENHPDTLTFMSNLASMYFNLGDKSKAQPMIISCLEQRRQIYGDHHQDTLQSMHDVARIYFVQGEFLKAEPIYQQCVEISQNLLGENHLDSLTYMNDLAGFYESQHQPEKAQKLYLKCLQIRQQIFGENHPSTITSLNDVAVHFSNQGQYDSAEPLYCKCVQISRIVLGDGHLDTISYVNNLACLYETQHWYELAEPLYLDVIQKRKLILGEEHPDTMRAIYNLAILYLNSKQYSKAEQLITGVVEKSEKILGIANAQYQSYFSTLLEIQQNMGKMDQYINLNKLEINKYQSAVGKASKGQTHLNNDSMIYSPNRNVQSQQN